MAEENDEPRTKRRWWPWVVAFPVLYVLSVGPANAIYIRWPSPSLASALSTMYLPLSFVVEHVPLIERLVKWYVDWFI